MQSAAWPRLLRYVAVVGEHVGQRGHGLAADDVGGAAWEGVVEECADFVSVRRGVRCCGDDEGVLGADVAREGFVEGTFADAALAENDGFDGREGLH